MLLKSFNNIIIALFLELSNSVVLSCEGGGCKEGSACASQPVDPGLNLVHSKFLSEKK